MAGEKASLVLRLWAAILVAYAVLLHGPATAATGIELIRCSTAINHAGEVAPNLAAHQIDSARLGDTCCALCASSISKLAILPVSVAVTPPTGGHMAPSAEPVTWLGAPLGSWAEARGPPVGLGRLTQG